MRRVLIIGLLFLLMSALPYLQAGEEGPLNSKSLAALGFVLLAAYTCGELAARLRLPKITGYIVAGLLCGPYLLNLFSLGVVEDLKLINNLAIGLIALTAGAEMRLDGLRAVGRTLGLVLLIKATLILLVVIATILALRPMLPFLADASWPLVAAVGMIFGVLAVETSPAATIAVINETGARGRLSDITLGVAVSKDVLMVVLLAVAISLARLFSTPGASFDAEILLRVGKDLLVSVASGATLGVAIIVYIKYARAEMWLFIIAAVFLTTALAERFHLEAVLIFIVAGFIVQNFSRYGDHFIHPVEAVSLPVYVVFFSIAGAGLDLGSLRSVWLIPLVLVVVRIGAIYLGAQLATTLAGEPPAVRRNAWLGFISQAGVVLGLVIIVEQNLPGLGSEMQPIVLGMIGINLILGPVAFKLALARAGETREARSEAVSGRAEGSGMSIFAPPPPERIRGYADPEFAAPALETEAVALRARLARVEEDFAARFLVPQAAHGEEFLARMREECMRAIDRLREPLAADEKWLARLRGSRSHYSHWLRGEVLALGAAEVDLSRHFRDLQNELGRLSSTVTERLSVTEEEERFTPLVGDSLRVRWGKRLKRARRSVGALFGRKESQREVPLGRLAAFHFGGAHADALLAVAALAGEQCVATLQLAKRLYDEIDEGHEHIITALEAGAEDEMNGRLARLRERLEDRFTAAREEHARFAARVEKELKKALATSYDAWLSDLAIAGTFELPAERRSLERAKSAREKATRTLVEANDTWAAYRAGLADACAKHLDAVRLVDQVGLAVDELVAEVLSSLDRNLAASLRAIGERAQTSRDHLFASFEAGVELPELRAALGREREACVNFLRGEMRARLRRLRESRELTAMVDAVLHRFAALAGELPEYYRVIDEKEIAALSVNSQPQAAPPLPRLKIVPLREIARSYLERAVARDLADVNQVMFEQVDAALSTTAETTQILDFNLKIADEELSRDGAPERERRGRARELSAQGFELALARVAQALAELDEAEERVRGEIISRVDERVREIEALAFQRPAAEAAREPRYVDLRRAFSRLRQRTSEHMRAWLARYGPLGRLFVKDLQATLGLEELSALEALERFDEARWDEERLAHLPYIYRRLFEIAPLDSVELLVARDEELRLIERARERLKAGRPSAIAVIGELGSGKTSLINAALKEIFRHESVYRINFTRTLVREEELAAELGRQLGVPRARTLGQIEARLAAMASRSVIVLEDAHQLYLRALGGYEALRALLLLVARTSHQVCWLVSMRKYAWLYLDTMLRISENFTFVVNTENLTAAQLEQVIARRHKVSGFELHFLPDEVLSERSRFRKAGAAGRQMLARAAYFESLSRASEGNILAGIFYWLRSLAEVRGNEIVVRPIEPLRFSSLGEMPVEQLLTLSLIIQEGNLTADELARVFLLERPASQAILARLLSLNLLVRETREDGTEQFAVNRPIYIPLTRELRSRNILPRR